MEELLKELIEKNRKFTADGNVANYIPELDKANKNALGIYVTTLDGQEFFAGDYNTKFTIQSISKIISLMLAILDNGEEYVFSKVGMEPSGDPFNSIRKLETSSRKTLQSYDKCRCNSSCFYDKRKRWQREIFKIIGFCEINNRRWYFGFKL